MGNELILTFFLKGGLSNFFFNFFFLEVYKYSAEIKFSTSMARTKNTRGLLAPSGEGTTDEEDAPTEPEGPSEPEAPRGKPRRRRVISRKVVLRMKYEDSD